MVYAQLQNFNEVIEVAQNQSPLGTTRYEELAGLYVTCRTSRHRGPAWMLTLSL